MSKRTDLLKSGSDYLAAGGIASPAVEAELFLEDVLNCRRSQLYLDNLAVPEKEQQYFWRLLAARRERFPLQYLLGSTEFMGLKFKLAPGVFIPRPETEILVETILTLLPTTYYLRPNILDIGTGCGNIATSLAKYLKEDNVFACDICDSALQLTGINCRLNEVRLNLLKSNLFGAFKDKNLFSLIISNPPYIPSWQIAQLAAEVHYEPRQALDGGEDGLFYYRRIINQAPLYLQDRGLLALEMGDAQARPIERIFEQAKRFRLVKIVKDYNNKERVIIARKIT